MDQVAHLSKALDDRYCEIERLHGSEGAKFAAESHTAAIDHIEFIVREEQIACDFVRLDGYFFARLVSLLSCWTTSLPLAFGPGLVAEAALLV